MQNIDFIKKANKANLNTNGKLFEIVKRMQKLRELGNDNKAIEKIIIELNFPLSLHLFIMGNFSSLMELKIK